jgi:hypothetical protein
VVRILSFTAWKSGSRDRGHGSAGNPRDGFYMASDFGGEGGILNGPSLCQMKRLRSRETSKSSPHILYLKLQFHLLAEIILLAPEDI